MNLEDLEKFAERAERLATDAWGEASEEMANAAAMEAFLHDQVNIEAAWSVVQKYPDTLDEVLNLVKRQGMIKIFVWIQRKGNIQFNAKCQLCIEDSFKDIQVAATIEMHKSEPKVQTLELEVKDIKTALEET